MNPVLAEKYFKKELDDKILCKNLNRNLQSLYQRDICHEEDIIQKGKRADCEPHATLSDDWYYPITSHTDSYRDPKILIDVDVRGRNIRKKEKDAFILSDEMQKIMKINTGQTVYRKDISELGTFIIDHAMHGEIKK